MKTARTQVASVFVDCPHCDGWIEHPVTGSTLWEMNDPVATRTIKCLHCGETVKVPKKLVRARE